MANSEASGGEGAVSVLRNRNFSRLFSAGIFSTSGSSIASIAIVWIVYSTTGSAFYVAFIGIVQVIATIAFSLPAGVLVDRHDRRRLMVASDLVRCVVVGALAAFILLVGFDLVAVLVVTFLLAGFSTIFSPAEHALLPSILKKENLASANGLIDSSRNTVQAIANAVGGALVLVAGAGLSLFYNSATFFVSASLVYAVSAPRFGAVSGKGSQRNALREIWAGLLWLVRSSGGLFDLTMAETFVNFFSTFVSVFLVVFSTAALHGNSLLFGILLAALTVGYGIGSLVAGRTRATRFAGKAWILVGTVAAGVATLAVCVLLNEYVAFVLLASFGVFNGFAANIWLTTAQRVVPADMQGRYFAVDGMLITIGVPIAEVVGAVLISSYGIVPTFEMAGIGLIVVGLMSATRRDLWHLHLEG